jgi:hypothetical protein
MVMIFFDKRLDRLRSAVDVGVECFDVYNWVVGGFVIVIRRRSHLVTDTEIENIIQDGWIPAFVNPVPAAGPQHLLMQPTILHLHARRLTPYTTRTPNGVLDLTPGSPRIWTFSCVHVAPGLQVLYSLRRLVSAVLITPCPVQAISAPQKDRERSDG